MWPILFQLDPFTIYNYGVSLAIAALVCGWLLSRDARLKGIAGDVIYDLMFWTVVSGIIGARIFYVFLAWDYYSTHLLEIILLTKGGLAWQGGFVASGITGVVFAKWRKIPVGVLFDLVAPYAALGQAIGRLGCFANGCCYGKPVSWGIYFPSFQANLHPTQLYEAGGLFLIFVLLKLSAKHVHKPGLLFAVYLWLVAIERFVVEFYRADQMAFVGNLSLFQWIALVVFVVGLIIFARSLKR